MKITALTENTSRNGLPVEHGLSLFIEVAGRAILFDTGKSNLFAENAARMGIDLSCVNFAVLSHGHYDHGGGLKKFFEINKKAPVYISRYAFEPHFNGEKYIGLDVSLKENPRFILTDGETRIAEGLTLFSCNERERGDAPGAAGLTVERGGERVQDDFRHEQYLLIEENGKRVLISGCSHKGIMNIAEWFKPDVLVGGFHFFRLPVDSALRDYARRLDGYDTVYYTCHCTGTEQYEGMKPHMRRLNYISAGDTIII